MEEAARCRRTAVSAVRDIEPERFRDAIESSLADGSTAPGVVAIASARAALRGSEDRPDPPVPDHVDDRAAGVQLIYVGLDAIRTLAREEPWAGLVTVEGGPPDEDLTEPNLAMLAADASVARGFYLLARTEAAGKAVETVRNFGRDQTHTHNGENRDVELEADVLELAVIAGVTAVGAEPTEEMVEEAAAVARRVGTPLPAAETILGEFDPAMGETPPTSADGTARTSATDP